MTATPDQKIARNEWAIELEGQVATIKWKPVLRLPSDYREHHLSLALALDEVRWDDRVRVIVIAGSDEGAFETNPPNAALPYDKIMNPNRPPGRWSSGKGIERTFETLALMEKPVVGRLKGNAFGFAGNVLFGCDIIVAAEDAVVCDFHLSMEPALAFGMSAGDGAMAFMPLFFPPTKLKELLLLGGRVTAKELARLNVINYAVPRDEVDPLVNRFVAELLRRPARPLARTKRAANKALIQQWNLSMDYSYLAERLDLFEAAAQEWKPDTSFHPEKPVWGHGEEWDFDNLGKSKSK
jgi:enoyl-CoA hydratase